jgi:hypothetical protein
MINLIVKASNYLSLLTQRMVSFRGLILTSGNTLSLYMEFMGMKKIIKYRALGFGKVSISLNVG